MFNCIPAYCYGAYWSDEQARLDRSKLCGTPDYPWEPCPQVLTQQEQLAQGTFGGCNWSAIGTFPTGSRAAWSPEKGCHWECPPGKVFENLASGAACTKPLTDSWNPGRFFTEIGIELAKDVARVGSAFATGGTSLWIEAAQQAIDVYQKENDVGIDLGGIFGGVATALGGLQSGSYLTALSGVGQLGQAFLTQPQPTYAMQPSYSQMPQYGIVPYSPPPPPVQAQPVGAFGVAGRAIATLTAPILAKIAVKLGLRSRPSLTRAMDMVRKAAKLLTSPEAVATALGITVAELATLITTSNARKRRRMNPANSKALRRAARRIKSFHRLCTHTDVLKSRGRKSSKSACGTCKRSPCRC